MKFYGAGVGSSVKEIHHAMSAGMEYKKLDLMKKYPSTDLIVQDIQPFFYYIEKFSDYLEQLKILDRMTKKDFSMSMNKDSTELFIDRKLKTFKEATE